MVALFGPEAHEAVFRAPDEQLSPAEAYKVTTPVFGENIVYDASPARMAEQLKMLLPALRDRRMRTYGEAVVLETAQGIRPWGEAGVVDLVEFCVTVPADEKWSRGLPRAVLRTALAQILPPAIAARRDKFDLTDLVRTSLLQRHSGLVHRALYEASEKLARCADLGKLRATWEAFRRSGTITGEGLQELWRSVMLQRWLQSRDSPGRATAGTNLAVPAE